MGQTERYTELVHEGTPWTRFARIQAGFFVGLSVILLGVGINSNAVVLISSGISGFENPWRAYLFSTIPIGLAAVMGIIK